MGAFTITVHHGLPYLLVEGSGPATLPDLCAYMDFVAEVARRKRQSRAVMNLLGIDIAFSFTEHLQLGSHAADRLKDLERVSSVVPERLRTGTSEKAAQKSGLRLKTFVSLEDGIAWAEGR